MKKQLITGIVTLGLVLTTNVGLASAWSYDLTGSGVCQPDGSFKITWNVDNSSEPDALNITASNKPSVVPVGSTVAAHQTKTFNENADGTQAESHTLTLKGNWAGDATERERTATVTLDKACTQPQPPTPPPTGGRGAGPVETPVATPPAPTPQVVVPKGSVNAGNGISETLTAPLVGLGASFVALGEGVRRLVKRTAAKSQ
jgi:hypothetical protein